MCGVRKRTVRAGDLAPDDTDLGAADLLLATVDVGNALAVVEGGSLGVVDTLDLDERGVGPDRVLRALERDVLAPVGQHVSIRSLPMPYSIVQRSIGLLLGGGVSIFRDSVFLLGMANVLDVKTVTLLGRHLDGCSGDLKGDCSKGRWLSIFVVNRLR